jgi:hypothetical protein
MEFAHPNAAGVLVPGQTKYHTGTCIPRCDGDGGEGAGTGDAEEAACAVPCSPTGQFPSATNTNGTAHGKGAANAASAGGNRENVSANLPMEQSADELMGCQACGCTMKWSCCSACCGGCRVWSEEGFLSSTSLAPNAAEFSSWDGCTDVPEDRRVAAPKERAEPG